MKLERLYELVKRYSMPRRNRNAKPPMIEDASNRALREAQERLQFVEDARRAIVSLSTQPSVVGGQAFATSTTYTGTGPFIGTISSAPPMNVSGVVVEHNVHKGCWAVGISKPIGALEVAIDRGQVRFTMCATDYSGAPVELSMPSSTMDRLVQVYLRKKLGDSDSLNQKEEEV
ncbi:hypothetical protein UFOVP28_24 [uncultured Caudovirales phage]|uniref:Uncharacterized protein n=1 Tax=uncultured Caudovirales phage TaxID=2100421 RepID=A0A6J5KRF0_9CAUD|nr:hypothetical protein UFOVP28_24 [uncultured Caudovirales phage]